MMQYGIHLGSSSSYSKKIFTLKKQIIRIMISALLQIMISALLQIMISALLQIMISALLQIMINALLQIQAEVSLKEISDFTSSMQTHI